MQRFSAYDFSKLKAVHFTISILLCLFIFEPAFSQDGVAINKSGADPHPSAMFDITSNNKGILIPRITKTARIGIPSPANGLLVYQVDDTIGFWYYDQNSWKPFFKQFYAGAGLAGGQISNQQTISLLPTGVIPAQYGAPDSIPQFTINQFGQLVFSKNIALKEVDGIVGNEIADTTSSLGILTKTGTGVATNPYKIGVNPGNSVSDIWVWNGSKWILQQLPTEQDAEIGNEISDTSQSRGILIRNGSGNASNPYTVGVRAGLNVGDVWMWNGNNWVSSPVVHPLEKDSILGNEIADTLNSRGVLERYGSGTATNPYQIGVVSGTNAGDVWMWNGTKWVSASISIPGEKDADIGNEVVDTTNARGILNIYGGGTTANPLKMGIEPGISVGDVWMWNGAKWVSSAIIHPTIPIEKDSVIGNEIADTINSFGILTRFGNGTIGSPYKIGITPGNSVGQSWVWNGLKWTLITIPKEKDSVIGNEIADTLNSRGVLVRNGAGTAANPYTIGVNNGTNTGDVWMWNGSKWIPTQIVHPTEVDAIIGNEITDTTNARGILNKSGAGTAINPYKLSINGGTNTGDVWMWNGNKWVATQIVHPTEVDAIIGNEVTDTIANGFLNLAGAGTSASPKKIGMKPGKNVGDVLIWNGTTWVSGYLGRNSLDMAYDEGGAGVGRTINADAGAVNIAGTDGMLVTGTFGTGATINASGAGTRMIYNPRLAAFRAGGVSSSAWNNANIGQYSFAGGLNTLAQDEYTFSMGRNTRAVGSTSIAMGDSSTTLLPRSIAIGNRSATGGVNSIAIGEKNYVYGQYSIILGNNSTSLGTNSTIIGEESMILSGYNHGYAMGYRDTVKGNFAVAIGNAAYAEGTGSVAIGTNVRTNNPYSVAIGNNAFAIADRSVALGSYVSTNFKNGSFVFGDASTSTVTTPAFLNQMTMRFDNGYKFYTKSDLSTGVSLNNGATSWSTISDRNQKENFEEINGEEILSKIKALPITKWNYIANPDSVKYIGPMAQDFHAAFGLGGDDSCGITTLAFDGVNLAAIKALTERTEKIEALENTVESQSDEIAALRKEIEELKKLIIAIQK